MSSSMHAPLYRVSGYGERSFFSAATRHTPTVALMLECSLRAFETAQPTPGFVRYATAPPIPALLQYKLTRSAAAAAARGAPNTNMTYAACSGDALLKTWTKDANNESLPLSSVEARLLQACIRAKDANWVAVRVKAVFKRRAKARQTLYYRVLVEGEGSGYCLNYRRSHRSASAYFLVRARGVVQLCTCKCVDVRSSGKSCSAFESTEFALSENEHAVLFGGGGSGSGVAAAAAGFGGLHAAYLVPVSGAVAKPFLDMAPAPAPDMPPELTVQSRFVSNGTSVDSALTADASAGLAFGLNLTTAAPGIFGSPTMRKRVVSLKRPASTRL